MNWYRVLIDSILLDFMEVTNSRESVCGRTELRILLLTENSMIRIDIVASKISKVFFD